MVVDDDIQMTSDGLNRLFGLREKYDLWITTPGTAIDHMVFSQWYWWGRRLYSSCCTNVLLLFSFSFSFPFTFSFTFTFLN